MDPLRVALFWDIGTCSLPDRLNRTDEVLDKIYDIAASEGRLIVFNAYVEDDCNCLSPQIETEFQSRAVTVVRCIRTGENDLLSRITTDAWAFAHDNPAPATLIFMTALAGNPNFTYAVSLLRRKQYTIILAVPSAINVPRGLRSQVARVLDWDADITETLGSRPQGSRITHYGYNVAPSSPFKYPSSLPSAKRVPASPKRSGWLNPKDRTSGSTLGPDASNWRRSPSIPRLLPLPGQQNDSEAAQDRRLPQPLIEMKELDIPNLSGTTPLIRPRLRPLNIGRHEGNDQPVIPSVSAETSSSPHSAPSSSRSLSLRVPTTGPQSDDTSSGSSLLFKQHFPSSYPSAGHHDLDLATNFGQLNLGFPLHPSQLALLRDPSQVRSGFLPLLQELEALLASGVERPLRSLIGSRLGRDVYTRAGANNFHHYVMMAEQEGLVELGGSRGTAWISLA